MSRGFQEKLNEDDSNEIEKYVLPYTVEKD